MNELNISIEHLTKSFYRPVLRDINLQITNESYLSIIGASGCGKSTLMNILGLIEGFDSGSYTFNGTSIENGNDYSQLRRDNIGFVFQNYNLIPTMTCRENILLPTLYRDTALENRLDSLAEELNIRKLLAQRVNTLSGGEKQRVAFARALILDPCILIADEPTGNLDVINRDIVLEMISHEHTLGRGVVLITHDMELSAKSKLAYELKDGVLHERC